MASPKHSCCLLRNLNLTWNIYFTYIYMEHILHIYLEMQTQYFIDLAL